VNRASRRRSTAASGKSFARIHWQNLANFGILALEFIAEDDYDRIEAGDTLLIDGARAALSSGTDLSVTNTSKDERYPLRHRLSPRQVEMVLAGGQIPLLASVTDTHATS
jgi:aconitase A